MLNTIPKPKHPYATGPCKCRKTLMNTLEIIKLWQKGEIESKEQWDLFTQVITASLTTSELVLNAPPKSISAKLISLKLARLIANLQNIITKHIHTRSTLIWKDLNTRSQRLRDEWETINADATQTRTDNIACAQIELYTRHTNAKRPRATPISPPPYTLATHANETNQLLLSDRTNALPHHTRRRITLPTIRDSPNGSSLYTGDSPNGSSPQSNDQNYTNTPVNPTTHLSAKALGKQRLTAPKQPPPPPPPPSLTPLKTNQARLSSTKSTLTM